jgi:dihydrofolate synthase/folylpolyglutamate synthase
LNTSPHLEKINERIRINGAEISDQPFAETITYIHALIEELLAAGKLRAHPTYFECVTAMAFEYFVRERVDFAVFEVGLGGRLDATNILSPLVTIITRIDFDHENFLGHSLNEIAAEKAGILKPGVPVVLAGQRPEAREVILARAKELGCPVIEPAQIFRVDRESMQDGSVRARVVEADSETIFEIAPSLPGRFQLQNALNAVAAARLLKNRGLQIPDDAVTGGIANTIWPGRLEKLHSRPDVYLDGAHNPGAARELAHFLEQNFGGRKVWLIYAALRDKAVDEVAGLVFPHAAEVIFTAPRTSRAVSAAQLAEIAGHHAVRFSVIPDAEHAFEHALAEAAPEDAIFVTGSLYLVGQLRQYWKQRAQVVTR